MTETIEGEVVAETTELPAVRAHEAMVTRAEVSVDDVVAQREKVKAVMQRVMEDGTHFGRIPGIDKPTLLKPGAEVLNTTFRLAPSYQSERTFHDDGHLTVVSKCVLTHAPSGMVLGEGEGLCSSREDKYAFRNAKRSCPTCGAEAVIKGKQEYGGGWLCWKKQGGCGAKFPDGDEAIEEQEAGKVANESLPDTWNTVLKMADKRALIAAVLNATAASDIFTQDIEDVVGDSTEAGRPPAAGAVSSDKREKMLARIYQLAGEADVIREDGERGKTLYEVEASAQASFDAPLADLDEPQLAQVGGDLKDWLESGCQSEFRVVPF